MRRSTCARMCVRMCVCVCDCECAQMRGDSFFVVNGEGKRVYNEKGAYDLRMRKHWDAPENKLLFMIGDQRCPAVSGTRAHLPGSVTCVVTYADVRTCSDRSSRRAGPSTSTASYTSSYTTTAATARLRTPASAPSAAMRAGDFVPCGRETLRRMCFKGDTIEALAAGISRRLDQLRPRTGVVSVQKGAHADGPAPPRRTHTPNRTSLLSGPFAPEGGCDRIPRPRLCTWACAPACAPGTHGVGVTPTTVQASERTSR